MILLLLGFPEKARWLGRLSSQLDKLQGRIWRLDRWILAWWVNQTLHYHFHSDWMLYILNPCAGRKSEPAPAPQCETDDIDYCDTVEFMYGETNDFVYCVSWIIDDIICCETDDNQSICRYLIWFDKIVVLKITPRIADELRNLWISWNATLYVINMQCHICFKTFILLAYWLSH